MDIILCSTKDLLDEIFNRFDHCIFAGIKLRGEETILTKRIYQGNSDTCIGLAHKIQNYITNQWEESRKNIPENFEE